MNTILLVFLGETERDLFLKVSFPELSRLLEPIDLIPVSTFDGLGGPIETFEVTDSPAYILVSAHEYHSKHIETIEHLDTPGMTSQEIALWAFKMSTLSKFKKEPRELTIVRNESPPVTSVTTTFRF